MNFQAPKTYNGFHLFMNPYSNCSQRVMLLCAEKGLTPTLHEIDLLKGAQLTEGYHAINPDCDVPAVVHNGRAMHDSVTIMRYLEQTFPTPPLAPTDAKLYVEMEQHLDQAADSHMTGVVPWIYASGIGRLPTPEQKKFYDEKVPHRSTFHNDRISGKVANDLQAAAETLDVHFLKLERILDHHDWLVGNSYSLADIAWAPNAIVLRILGFDLTRYPNLCRWVARVEARPAFQTGVKQNFKPIPNWLIRQAARLVRKTGNRK